MDILEGILENSNIDQESTEENFPDNLLKKSHALRVVQTRVDYIDEYTKKYLIEKEKKRIDLNLKKKKKFLKEIDLCEFPKLDLNVNFDKFKEQLRNA